MAKQWDMIRLFESVNKTNIPSKSILKENVDNRQFDIKAVVDSYLETAFWTDAEEPHEFDGKTIYDIAPESRAEAQADIEKFISIAQQQAPEELATYDASQLGHNLWLSRNGHGAGFFDDNNDKLQDIARNMKGKYMYVGDDQAVYIQEQIDDLRDSNLEASVGLGEQRDMNIPFEKIAEFFNHYKIDVSSLNPDAVKNVYRVWDEEADFEGLSDMEEEPDGRISIELDGMYGKHWMSFENDEQWQKYYENNILADARQAFEGLYKEYDLKSQAQNVPKDMTDTLGDTHGDVLSKLKAKMSEDDMELERKPNQHLEGKRKVLAKNLKAGDHIVGLGKGLKVVRGASAGVSTPAGKVDLVVEYPNGEKYLKIWNKNTVIMIYEKPLDDTMSERHLVIPASKIYSQEAIKSANAIYDMHDQDIDQSIDYVKRNAADTMDAEEIIEILRNSTASDERPY